ncbi:MAG: recombinase family protein [Solobacterium sp.]|nr:recombinase family protein [Solobacterium sp.]
MSREVEIIKGQGKIRKEEGKLNKTIKVAAYCRVSTGSQEQLNSYESQKKYYSKRIADEKGWILAGIYADEAITGTKVEKRNNFKKMVDDAIDGKIDLIICKSISRFARNTVDTLQYVRLLKEHGVEVFFEEENIRTLTMDGELLLTILSSVAQQEVENMSEHVRYGLKHKMAAGELVGFSGCLGYDYDPITKTISINEEEAEIVRYIYKRYMEGVGCHVIAHECEARGWHNKRGGSKWYEATVRGILRNEKYKGDLLSGKTFTVDPISKRRLDNLGEDDKYLVKNHHEPIVSEKEWEFVQRIFAERNKDMQKAQVGASNRYVKKYGFSGKLVCGYCGHLLTRRTRRKNSEIVHDIWHCGNSIANGCHVCPECKSILELDIQAAFVESYNDLVKKRELDVSGFIKNLNEVLEINHDEEMHSLEREISKYKTHKSKILDLLVEEKIDKEQYENKLSLYNQKIKQINARLTEIKLQEEKDSKFRKELNDFKTEIQTDQIMEKFDQEIFDKLVKKVIIGEINEEGVVNPYSIKFVYRTGWSDKKEGKISKIDRRRKNSISQSSDEVNVVSHNSSVDVEGYCRGMCKPLPSGQSGGHQRATAGNRV